MKTNIIIQILVTVWWEKKRKKKPCHIALLITYSMTFRILYSQQLIMCAFKKKLTRKWCVLLSFASNKVQNVPCLGNVFIPAFSYQWKLLISNHQYLFLLLLILYKIFYLGYISLVTYFQIVHLDIQNKKINKLHFFITIAWKSWAIQCK